MDFNSIGLKIKKRRQEINMTQEALAEKLDISTSFLSRVENGISIAGFETYCKICKELDTTLDYLTQDILISAKRKQSEIIFGNLIKKLNKKQIEYILNTIENFIDYLEV